MASDFVTAVQQFVCGLQGHDSLMQFERGRLSLKCVSCGHQTPGWEIRRPGEPAQREHVEAAPVRRRFLPHFAGARRLA